MSKTSYFIVGSIVSCGYPDHSRHSFFDLFDGHDEWVKSIKREAEKNQNYKLILRKAEDSGFLLYPKFKAQYKIIHSEGKKSNLVTLIYQDSTVYRRIFRNRKEAIKFAETIGVARKWSLEKSKVKIEALKEAFIKALPHEWGHHVWKYVLTDEQKGEWSTLVVRGHADIDFKLLQKGYSEDKLDEESFCSFLNAWVCPDAKNLSGAKLTPKIELFLQKQLELTLLK